MGTHPEGRLLPDFNSLTEQRSPAMKRRNLYLWSIIIAFLQISCASAEAQTSNSGLTEPIALFQQGIQVAADGDVLSDSLVPMVGSIDYYSLAANRLVKLRRTVAPWNDTWYWTVGGNDDAANLTGVTALGLIEANVLTRNRTFLATSILAARFIMAHLGSGATGQVLASRLSGPDIVFLNRLSNATGNRAYSARAKAEWKNIKTVTGFETATDMDAYFKSINRRLAWDIAFFLEAAYQSGDIQWANTAAAVLANTSDPFYYDKADPNNVYYALNTASALRALRGCYFRKYPAAITTLTSRLVQLVDRKNGVNGRIQDTAYAAQAFKKCNMISYTLFLNRWLGLQQEPNGAWIEADGIEYPQVDGEALRAMCLSILTPVTQSAEPPRLKASSDAVPQGFPVARPF